MTDLKPVILVVDDESGMLNSIRRIFRRETWQVVTVMDGARALELCREEHFDLVISDVRMPVMSGLEFLAELRKMDQATPVIIMTAYGSISAAVEAMKAGASEYITKPLDHDELLATVKRLLEKSPRPRRTSPEEPLSVPESGYRGILGVSEPMRKVFRLIRSVAPTDSTVLIQGETGTGKELVARAIHRDSRRSDGPFVPVNCSAISESLFESELFGHVKGAFTGAVSDKQGLMRSAQSGTLFLDEIGEMPLELQSKLLRVLQEREMTPVGSTVTVKVDIRLIAATNRDLTIEVREGSFREDLFYRLHVIPISLPPLREREEDISLLARSFLEEMSERLGRRIDLSEQALRRLKSYAWPGNVRQLRNALESAATLCGGETLEAADLPQYVSGMKGTDSGEAIQSEGLKLREIERESIARALAASGGNKRQAAQELGISRATLYRKLKEYGLGD